MGRLGIRYINPGVRAPAIPSCEGDCYDDFVPDTSDVQERIALAAGGYTGQTDPEVDEARVCALPCSIGPDGLAYTPLEGRPWSRLDSSLHEFAIPVFRANGSTTTIADRSATQVASVQATARLLSVLMIYHLRDGESPWRTHDMGAALRQVLRPHRARGDRRRRGSPGPQLPHLPAQPPPGPARPLEKTT